MSTNKKTEQLQNLFAKRKKLAEIQEDVIAHGWLRTSIEAELTDLLMLDLMNDLKLKASLTCTPILKKAIKSIDTNIQEFS
ncbi:MAG: hypothetical protein ACOCWM_01030 [Cyclobacteriaceae bacterium]